MLRLSGLLLALTLLASACKQAEDPSSPDLASPLEGIYQGEIELYAPNISYELHLQQQLEVTKISNNRIAVEPLNSSQVEPFTAELRRSATGLTLFIAPFQTSNNIRVEGAAIDSAETSIHGRYENSRQTFRYALNFNEGAQLEHFEGIRLD